MNLTDSSDHWYWTAVAFPPAAFCVRALVLDGLSVPPFDRHPDGDGRLRKLGLGAGIWRDWVALVLQQHGVMDEYVSTMRIPPVRGPLFERARAAGEVLRLPGSFCPGPDALRAQLNDWFTDYALAGEAWKWRMSDARRLHGSGRQQRALWKALTPFHDRLASLSVFLVEYPEPVVMLLPPAVCFIAPAEHPDGFRHQVVEAATGLAALA